MKKTGPNILIVSSYDVGGASLAALRLHLALLQHGHNSRFLCLHRSRFDIPEQYQFSAPGGFKQKIKLKLRQRAEHQQRQLLTVPEGESLSGEFSPTTASYEIYQSPHWEWADVVNLHWVNEWISFENLLPEAGSKKLVYTMHDMHAFTGGCHYSHDCDGFEKECQDCPLLERSSLPQLAHQYWKSRKTALSQFKPQLWVTAPSQWMVNLAAKSSLLGNFPGSRIFNSVETHIFHPRSQQAAREVLGLPTSKTIILTVIQSLQDKRKGFNLLVQALKVLENPDAYCLCTVGKWDGHALEIPVEHQHLGSILDEKLMAIVYNSASILAHPAIEDNLPNVVVEALCCGIPVAGFQIGGMPEMVENGKNGFLSAEISPEGLTMAIEKAQRLELDRMNITQAASQKFGPEAQATAFMDLIQKVVPAG